MEWAAFPVTLAQLCYSVACKKTVYRICFCYEHYPSFHNIYLENKSSLSLSELTKQTYRINHKHLYIIWEHRLVV